MRLFIVSSSGATIEAPRSPFAYPRPEHVRVGDSFATAEVAAEVAAVLQDVVRLTFDVARARLAPFGLHPYDIAAPRYERFIYKHEITGGTSR